MCHAACSAKGVGDLVELSFFLRHHVTCISKVLVKSSTGETSAGRLLNDRLALLRTLETDYWLVCTACRGLV
jgi:hypothetical protein